MAVLDVRRGRDRPSSDSSSVSTPSETSAHPLPPRRLDRGYSAGSCGEIVAQHHADEIGHGGRAAGQADGAGVTEVGSTPVLVGSCFPCCPPSIRRRRCIAPAECCVQRWRRLTALLSRIRQMAVLPVSRLRAWFRTLSARRREKLVAHRWAKRQKKFARDVTQLARDEQLEYEVMESRQKASEELEDQGVGFISTYYPKREPTSALDPSDEPDDEVIAVYLANREFLRELVDEIESLADLECEAPSEADGRGIDDSQRTIGQDIDYFKRRLATMKRSTKRKVVAFVQIFEARMGVDSTDRNSFISMDELKTSQPDANGEDATDAEAENV